MSTIVVAVFAALLLVLGGGFWVVREKKEISKILEQIRFLKTQNTTLACTIDSLHERMEHQRVRISNKEKELEDKKISILQLMNKIDELESKLGRLRTKPKPTTKKPKRGKK